VLLEQLADTANGQYRYIDTLDEADRVFRDDLLGTLITIARNVKVQVEFDPDVVRSYRLVGFENRDVADRDFRDDRVDGGEIGAGHSVTALYEVELVDRARRDALGTVFVRWESADSREINEISGDIMLDLIADRWSDADARFRLAATVAAFAEQIREGRFARSFDIDDVYDEIDTISEELDDPDVTEFRRIVRDFVRDF
jgi:Ca-activated chloride channel homolog